MKNNNKGIYIWKVVFLLTFILCVSATQTIKSEAAKKSFKYNVNSGYDFCTVYKLSGGKWKKKGGKYYYYKKGKKQYKPNKYAYYSLKKGGKKYAYFLDPKGARVTGWVGVTMDDRPDSNGNLKTTVHTGKSATNALSSGKVSTLNYYDKNGVMVKNGVKDIGGEKYIFLKDGSLATEKLCGYGNYYTKDKKIYYGDKMGKYVASCDYWVEPKVIIYKGIKMQKVHLDQEFMVRCVNEFGTNSIFSNAFGLIRKPNLKLSYQLDGITERTWEAKGSEELADMADESCKKVIEAYHKDGYLYDQSFDYKKASEFALRYNCGIASPICARITDMSPLDAIIAWMNSDEGHFEDLCSSSYLGFACYYDLETGDYFTVGACGEEIR